MWVNISFFRTKKHRKNFTPYTTDPVRGLLEIGLYLLDIRIYSSGLERLYFIISKDNIFYFNWQAMSVL